MNKNNQNPQEKTTMDENKKMELSEDQLDAATGGWSWNNYEPGKCENRGRVIPDSCQGWFRIGGRDCYRWCDHYRREELKDAGDAKYHHKCVKGGFDYKSKDDRGDSWV